MVILKLDALNKYAKYLKEHPEETEKLFEDVLIPVTSFFRDFEAFEALKTQVYPGIVKDKGNKSAIRIWAPGCSTGEETYSLAMTLLEFLGDKAPSFQVQIFGTDLNEKGIEKARVGLYRESIAEEISPERLSRFFLNPQISVDVFAYNSKVYYVIGEVNSPGAFPLQGRRYNWAYETDPEPYMDGRRMECGRGKGPALA